jgi:hypothetical protein
MNKIAEEAPIPLVSERERMSSGHLDSVEEDTTGTSLSDCFERLRLK